MVLQYLFDSLWGLFCWYDSHVNQKSPYKQLIQRAEADHRMRMRFMKTRKPEDWDDEMDRKNTIFLKGLVKEHGWPTVSKAGEKGEHAAWLLVQHADHDLDFQAECLALMKEQTDGEVTLSSIAYLEDRVRLAQDRPQLYGTQFQRINGELTPSPIEDIEHLEERRQAMGLEPFEANQQRLREQSQ